MLFSCHWAMGAARIDTFHVREANLVKSCFRQYSAYCVLRLATLRPCSDSPEEGNEGEGKRGISWPVRGPHGQYPPEQHVSYFYQKSKAPAATPSIIFCQKSKAPAATTTTDIRSEQWPQQQLHVSAPSHCYCYMSPPPQRQQQLNVPPPPLPGGKGGGESSG